MNIPLIGFVIVLAVAGLQTVRLADEEADHAKTISKHALELAGAVDRVRKEGNAHQKGVDDAVKKANLRADAERLTAAAARTERDSLRNELADARTRIPTATCTSVREYASTLSGLFDQCAAEYLDVASKAQGHASDVRTLMDAWPKNVAP